MDDLLSSVVGPVEVVRSLGTRLLSLAEKSRNSTGRSDHILEAFAAQDVEVRQVLESVHAKILHFDKSEMMAVSGQVKGDVSSLSKPIELSTPTGFYEDSEASRTIAIKGVARDVAHTLQSEVSWRKNAFLNASEMNKYFHQRLAMTFPHVPVGPERRGELIDGSLTKSNNSVESLEQVLANIPGLVSFEIKRFNSSKLINKVICRWNVGLSSVLDYARCVSSTNANDDEFDNIRAIWIHIETTANVKPKPIGNANFTLARTLTIEAQQQHFQLLQSNGERDALIGLLRWTSAKFAKLESACLKSDFASPLHLG